MKRRRFLGTVVAVGASVVGGFPSGVRPVTPGLEATPPVRSPTSVAPRKLPVPTSRLHQAVQRDDIAAITDPAFDTDWTGLEMTVDPAWGEDYTARPRLSPEDRLIGIERGGQARAYPLRVLNWHEVVNDRLDGPLLVTYCPLCGSGMTAKREVCGASTTFGVSGMLWRSNLVMYDDRTGSRWGQVAATAIRGPKTGTDLQLLPSTTTTWGAWTKTHPDTEVLLPPPESITVRGPRPGINVDASVTGSDRYAKEVPWDYGRDPYADYEDSTTVGVGENAFRDDRLHPKAVVLGVTAGGTARAYPLAAVAAAGVVNDTVGGHPVVVTVAPGRELVAYVARLAGRRWRFEAAGDAHLRAAGSRWERASGRAVDGPHRGTRLEPATSLSPMFWFAWVDFHPGTDVYSAPA